jgi:hypothetical protein
VELLIGTGGGVYRANGGEPAAIDSLRDRSVRVLVRSGGTLFAGANDGIYSSADGQAWQKTGAEGREVWDIVPAPGEPGTIFAGTAPAGLFRTRDGGRTWDEVESFAHIPGAERWCVPTRPPQGARARTVVLDRANPARWWVGVEVGGVARSQDAGASWQVSLPGTNPDIHVMANHPRRSDTLFATTGYGRIDGVAEQVEGNAGLFRSTDGGESWHYLWTGRLPRYTRPMVIDEREPHALTVGCAPTAFSSHRDAGGAQAMLYRSDDGGDTWRSLCDAAHTPSSACLLSVNLGARAGDVIVGTDTGEVWSVTAQADWTLLASGLPPVWATLVLG